MDLDARKPVFVGLRTTQVQTSLRIRAVWSAPLLFAYWEVSYLVLRKRNFNFLVTVAEETGFKLALSDTLKTGFLATGPNTLTQNENFTLYFFE